MIKLFIHKYTYSVGGISIFNFDQINFFLSSHKVGYIQEKLLSYTTIDSHSKDNFNCFLVSEV